MRVSGHSIERLIALPEQVAAACRATPCLSGPPRLPVAASAPREPAAQRVDPEHLEALPEAAAMCTQLGAQAIPQQGRGDHLSVLEKPMEVRGLNMASLPPARRSEGPVAGVGQQTVEVSTLLPGVWEGLSPGSGVSLSVRLMEARRLRGNGCG